VKLDALKPWIHEKLTEILGFEDDVVIDYAINQLEETNTPDPKIVQINLTGFLNAKVTLKNGGFVYKSKKAALVQNEILCIRILFRTVRTVQYLALNYFFKRRASYHFKAHEFKNLRTFGFLKVFLFDNLKKSNARKFVHSYTLKWYETRRPK